MSGYYFSAVCLTCEIETIKSENMALVGKLAQIHTLRRLGHEMIYRTHERDEVDD
jgi:hypothetical protein